MCRPVLGQLFRHTKGSWPRLGTAEGAVLAPGPQVSSLGFILPLQQKPFPPTLTSDPERGSCFSLVPPEPCAIWESCSCDLHSQIPTWPWLPRQRTIIFIGGATAWLSSVTVRQITPTSWQHRVWPVPPGWESREPGCDAWRPVAAKPRKQPRPRSQHIRCAYPEAQEPLHRVWRAC